MRIRLKVSPQEERQAANEPPADFLFRKAFIPKYDPFTEYIFPVALYCFCTLVYNHGGRELWEKHRRRYEDPLAEEAQQAAGRLSLSLVSSVALHLAGVLMLIPLFDLLASMKPEVSYMRTPVIQPILVKVPTRVVLPNSAGESEVSKELEGKGREERPEAGSDSAAELANRGVEPPKPALKADESPRDTGRPEPTVIADLQLPTRHPELPSLLLWTEKPKPEQAPESVAATAIKRPAPPEPAPEKLLAMTPKKLEIDPKLTLEIAPVKQPPVEDAIERPDAPDTSDETIRRNVEMRASVGTGDESEEGIRLMTSSRDSGLQRLLELVPASQMKSLSNEDGPTGGGVYAIGELTVPSRDMPRYLPGRTGGSGTGTGGFGSGAGDGVGRGSAGGDDAGAKASIEDLLAALELAEPERARMVVHAEDGNFDLVVTQTSLSDVFAGARGVLKGDRIETVYIKVGTPKEWILQYCEPSSGQAKSAAPQSGSVFLLEDTPAPLTAPYPSITVRPPSPLLPKATYVMVHGFITAEGLFDKLEVVGARFRSLLPMLKPSLSKWRFRPAVRDGKPVAVEILLLIPPVAI